jgi:hypothetical protein
LKSIITTWIFISVLSFPAYSQTFYTDQFWKPKAFVAPTTTTIASFSTGVTATVIVSVNLTDTINKVLPTQFSTNSNFRSSSSILTRIPLYNKPTFGEFRFPASSGSNQYFWVGIGPADTSNMDPTKGGPILSTSSSFSPTVFSQFVSQTDAQANIVVNYFMPDMVKLLSIVRLVLLQLRYELLVKNKLPTMLLLLFVK